MDNAPQGECPVCRTPVDKLVPVRKMDEVRAAVGKRGEGARERRCRSAGPSAFGHYLW